MTRFGITSIVASGLAVAASQSLPARHAAGACCAVPSPVVAERHSLTLEGANRILAAAIAEAHQRNAGGAIAVVDDGGNLIALQRLDGTFAAGANVSIGKARTAAMFKK